MMYDDDALDRALAALPLEEPPAGLHARIMSATVHRPAPLASNWETWVIGTLVALGAWLVWIFAVTPQLTERFAAAVTQGLDSAGLTSTYTVMWLAVGVSAAWWLSQLSIPASRRIRTR